MFKKWIAIQDRTYLPEYEFGMYDLEYAKTFCDALNTALKNKTCAAFPDDTTEFRLLHKRHITSSEIIE